ncbi:MAG: hypothetical protein ACJAQ1_000818, partial [Flavobacterium sp.]
MKNLVVLIFAFALHDCADFQHDRADLQSVPTKKSKLDKSKKLFWVKYELKLNWIYFLSYCWHGL